MSKFLCTIIGCLVLLAGAALSQEVVIYDFPIGVAGSVDQEIFRPYYDGLEAVADTLEKYPLAVAVVTGGADGERYRVNNDAQNPALALGRAHALRDLLMREFGVDSSRIYIRTEDVKEKGPQYRYAAVRIVRVIADVDERVNKLKQQVDTLLQRAPVEKHFTEIKEVPVPPKENLGVQFGVGLSSSPFGMIPVASSAFTYKRIIYVEGIVGHTFWNRSFEFEGVDLDTKRRMLGGYAMVFPYEDIPIGAVGGWLRVEEISQDYYEYVKLSEGLVLGLRAMPLDWLSVTAAWNPSKQRVVDRDMSESKNGQFLIFAQAHILFGGER
ncbi:MAG: hypothetical protein AB1483_02175 [Candidatus Zixiibacteriota bacterium]